MRGIDPLLEAQVSSLGERLTSGSLQALQPGSYTVLLGEHPELDVQHLRTLIRNARKEQAENKPPKAYREIFQILKDLSKKGAAAKAGDIDVDGEPEDDESDDE